MAHEPGPRTSHWLRTSVALAASVGASVAPGAGADAARPPADMAPKQQSAGSDVLLKEIGGTLFFSERGGAFRELPVQGEAAAALRALIRASGAADGAIAADVGRTVVADGGEGFHQNAKDKPGPKKDAK